MDLSEQNTGPETSSAILVADLERSYRSLRSMFRATLLILLVLTGSICLYLLREVSFARRQVKELTQFVANYDNNSKPAMQDFLNRLQAFAKTNPDFAPILAKYYNPTNPPAAVPQTNLLQPDPGASSVRMPPTIPGK